MYLNKMNSEFLLNPQNNRIRVFPIQYNDIWEFYKNSVASFWVPEEISLTQDLLDWDTLEENEKHFILMVLAFFASSDFIVNENLDEDFTENIQIPELKMYYHFQEMMEDIHSQTYLLFIDTLVKDEIIKDDLFNSVRTIDSIKKKAEWARQWISNGSFVERLVAFACVEGIFFSASFCSIFWLRKRGLMPGLAQANMLISRDEGMHRDMSILLFKKYIINKLDNRTVINMIKSAVEVEIEFVKQSLPYKLKGMNVDLMIQYVKYVANHLSINMIDENIYNDIDNPFPWMSMISLEGKTDFFSKRVVNYAKQSVITEKTLQEIKFDAEF
jgi:ribonucleoside-diphosphate reductase beta chain